MGLYAVTSTDAPDHDNPDFIRARAFVCIQTLDKCRARLVTQMSNASAIWKEKLTEKTQAYRELMRDDTIKAESAKAKAFDKSRKLLAERDKTEAEKKKDMDERKAKIALVDEADAEAKAYKPGDGSQLILLQEPSKVDGMPWATDKTLGVIYTALRDLDESGARLDSYQEQLMMELADAQIEGADLGLEAAAAIEDDGDTDAFEDDEAELDAIDEEADDDVF